MPDHSTLKPQLLELLGDKTEYFPALLVERFPHIVQRILSLWGKPQLNTYLHGLLAPVKEGCSGFPKQALIEIASIKAFCHHLFEPEGGYVAAKDSDPCPRETFLALVDFDFSAYPVTLEAFYPHLLRQIANELDNPDFNSTIDALLSPAGQLEHGFSEKVLVELMTLKAANFARRAAATNQAPVGNHFDDKAHEASMIFDRIYHW